MKTLETMSSRDLSILRGEYEYRLEANDPLPTDFRRWGDDWQRYYAAQIARIAERIAKEDA